MSEIQGHLEEIYHTEVSKELISTVTDGIIEEVTKWQNRSLDEIYPILNKQSCLSGNSSKYGRQKRVARHMGR